MEKIRGMLIWVLGLSILTGCSLGFRPGDSLEDLTLVWQDYEKAVYDFYSGGEKRMPVIYTIEKAEDGNQTVFKNDFWLELEEGFNGTGAVIDPRSWQPISSYNRRIPPENAGHERTEMVGTYTQDKLQLHVVRGEKEQKMSIRIPEYVIDNESSLMLIRNFPLAEGYVKNVNLSVVGTGMVAPYRVTATNRESITVPYGTFECYKVVWQYTGRGSAPDITSWYSTDEARLLVQYTQQSVRFELAEYSTNREE